jgi:3'(2'), 5'-bisphosphate nucleotidase
MFEEIELEEIESIARDAAEAIMQIYSGDFDVEYKADSSPLTVADRKSNEIICSSLRERYPDIPILSEENAQVPYEERKEWKHYWCIDPIDGTKEFIKRNGEFTINIALIYENRPVLGVVYVPATGDIYSAKEGEGAWKNGRRLPLYESGGSDTIRVVASKSHLSEETQSFIDRLAQNYANVEQVSRGSSLKLCMVAEGSADIYPRLAPTMEWDTAAADAVVRASGKMSYRLDADLKRDGELIYNKENLLNPWFVVQ